MILSDYSDWMKDIFKKMEIKPEQIIRVKKMKSKLQSVRNNISEYFLIIYQELYKKLRIN